MSFDPHLLRPLAVLDHHILGAGAIRQSLNVSIRWSRCALSLKCRSWLCKIQCERGNENHNTLKPDEYPLVANKRTIIALTQFVDTIDASYKDQDDGDG